MVRMKTGGEQPPLEGGVLAGRGEGWGSADRKRKVAGSWVLAGR